MALTPCAVADVPIATVLVETAFVAVPMAIESGPVATAAVLAPVADSATAPGDTELYTNCALAGEAIANASTEAPANNTQRGARLVR